MRHHAEWFRTWYLALLVAITISLDVYWKSPQDRQEVMWACYWASLSIVAGIALASNLLVSSGVVFFLAAGVPGWLLGLVMGRPFGPTSILIHVVPPISGCWYLYTYGQLAPLSSVGAWLLYVIPMLIAWNWCDPAYRINLVHWIWPPLAPLVHSARHFQLLMLSIVGLVAACSELSIRRLGRLSRPNPRMQHRPSSIQKVTSLSLRRSVFDPQRDVRSA